MYLQTVFGYSLVTVTSFLNEFTLGPGMLQNKYSIPGHDEQLPLLFYTGCTI